MTSPSGQLTAAVRQMAQADFSALARRFGEAGFSVAEPAPGMITLTAPGETARPALLLSVGVHGDETAPIEMLAQLLDRLAPASLAVDLMVCVGNIDAIARGQRFIDADLNRMFRAERGTLAAAAEAARADVMIAATSAFFANAAAQRWHLDLHTAIRPSVYPTFAVVASLIADGPRMQLVHWLGQAGIGAVILNPQSAGTYSYYTAEHHGAAASTVELGRVGTLGENDLTQFADVDAALDALLRGLPPAASVMPHVFEVAQEIVKHSAAFTMAFGRDTQNFTAFEPGALIATDGDVRWRVGAQAERVVFPNPDVRVGLRAGLMVVRTA